MRGKTAGEIEGELREQFQGAYQLKLQRVIEVYNADLTTIKDSIHQVFERIKKDELLSTMLNDKTTSLHMEERVNEIFAELVTQERELLLKKVAVKMSHLHFENEDTKRQLRKLRENNNSLEKEFVTERLTFEQTRNNVNEELKKTQEEKHSILVDKNSKEQQLYDLKQSLKEYGNENSDLKALLKNISGELEQYKNELDHQKSKAGRLEGSLDQLSRKYEAKKKDFHRKIEEYKDCINKLRNRSSKFEAEFKSTEEVVTSTKVTKLIKEHEGKVVDLRKSHDREKLELQRKYERKLKESQDYFQKMMQGKVREMEDNMGSYYQKMREEGLQLERRIEMYEDNYISQADFEQKISEKDEFITVLGRKLKEFQASKEALARSQEGLIIRLRDSEQSCSEYKQKAYELEELNRQAINKYKSFEQSNSIFKINQKKVKEQFEDYEKIVKKTKQENEDLRGKCFNLEDAKGQFENTIRDKDRKIKENQEQIEVMSKQNKKSREILESWEKEKQVITEELSRLKKEVTSLEYKLRDQELAATFASGSLQARKSSLEQELKDKVGLMSELRGKYDEMSGLYQEEKTKNYEVQNLLKKYEMESKFYRQSGDMHKSEHQAALDESRKVLSEKNKRIEQLQLDLKEKAKMLKNTQEQVYSVRENSQGENRRLKTKLKMVSKMILEKMQGVRKEGRVIRDYLKSRDSIVENDSAIWLSTFRKELVHLQGHLEEEKDKAARKIKEQLQKFNANEIKLVRNEIEQKGRNILEKHEIQKNLLKQEIRQKDDRAQELSQEIKKWQLEVKKEKDAARNIEKELQLFSNRNEQVKEQNEHKLRQLVKEMKEEKDSIVCEYNDRRLELESQIGGLLQTISQLKSETQLIHGKHEEDKLTINSQLRTMKEQEEAIQRVSLQKDQEIVKHKQNYETADEARRKLESQLKGYADTLNGKIQMLHELQLKDNQLEGELNLMKNRFERTQEENQELKRKLGQRDEDQEEMMRTRTRMQAELRDIKGALNRSNKNQDLRSLNELSMETLQLSHKVNEMRKYNTMLENKTPLRS